MKLSDYVCQYADGAEYALSTAYIEQLENAVRLLEQCHGHTIYLNDLSDTLVNRFVAWMADSDRSPATIRNRRAAILSLWRRAYMDRLVSISPKRVKRVRCPRLCVRAWSAAEVSTLLRTALSLDKLLPHKIPAALYFASLIATAWDSALRLGDLLRLKCCDMRQIGPYRTIQSKTQSEITFRLRAYTHSLVCECIMAGPKRTLVWPLWGRREAFYRRFNTLVSMAGITNGTFRFIRRGSITNVLATGGNAVQHAGHSSPVVTARHYVDTSLLPPPSMPASIQRSMGHCPRAL